jgi:hypothetical protein
MKADDYLERLRSRLSGFSEEERSEILEEIADHISEAQSDPKFGQDNREKLLAELGSPDELGVRLSGIHHPRMWLEYILIILPALFFSQILSALIALTFPYDSAPTAGTLGVYLGIRLTIIAQLVFSFLGYKLFKQQRLITGHLFWVSSVWLTIFSMCFREKRWFPSSQFNQSVIGIAGSIFWSLVLVSLLFWLTKVLWTLKDPQYFVLVAIPFFTALGNLSISQKMVEGGFPIGYNLSTWQLAWFGLHQLARALWPAMLIFSKNRSIRWVGLLVYAAPLLLMNLVASSHYPYLMAIWSIPILLVAFSWLYESIVKSPTTRID